MQTQKLSIISYIHRRGLVVDNLIQHSVNLGCVQVQIVFKLFTI